MLLEGVENVQMSSRNQALIRPTYILYNPYLNI